MFMKKLHILCLLCLSLSLLTAYAQSEHHLPLPKIEYGIATLSGSITGDTPSNIDISTISIVVTNPLAYFADYTLPVDEDGLFSIRIPSFGITHGFINSPVYTGNIFLLPNEETVLNISFDKNGHKHIDVTEKLGVTKDDLQRMGFVLSDILADEQKVDSTFGPVEDGGDFIRYSSLYLQIAKEQVSERNEISPSAQKIIQTALTTFLFSQLYLDYYGSMKRSYSDRHHAGGNIDYDQIDYRAPEIDSTYFSFFEAHDLNSPYYLYSSYLQPFFQDILKDETLSIPEIGEYSPDSWTALVKGKLGHAIGADTGLFYDLLTANAYVRQLTALRLLSDSQKDEIRAYFPNKAFSDFLLEENERIQQLIAQNRSSGTLTIHETPDMPKEQLMDVIIAKYKDKVVFVDFWATWCAPCLQGMQESAPVKKAFEDKDVAFVYITTTSSPPKIWLEKIKDIGGDHYYLDGEQWEYVLDSLGFSGIPTYFIYDKQGKQKRKHTMFMGVENMRDWISELL